MRVAYTAESRWSFEDITTDEDRRRVGLDRGEGWGNRVDGGRAETAAAAPPERISVSASAGRR